ncbi:MAG TPA: FAD-binding oxidoreductase [Solirubrobacteraceae bacterium]|nr:FAD-binding oxidoreductase [Solirubrobacteraceae bacterium]
MSAATATRDVVVIGAGAVGAACAYYLSDVGLSVTVLDRGSVASGTTGAGEGNILVSDKSPGVELELALLSSRLWRELEPEVAGPAELELKGGLVVAPRPQALDGLRELAAGQAAAGVQTETVGGDRLQELEPELARDLPGAILYPQDMQVQPMLAAAHLLAAARARGAQVRLGEAVTALRRTGERVTGVVTSAGEISAGAVVNATGAWASHTASLAGVHIPILPRRGFILVTEPLGAVIRHKVYDAAYVADVASSAEGLETSAVVEGTQSGTVLIGATRERVGFDAATSTPVLARLARQAIRLFPMLEGVRSLRAYRGFRPYCPDHLPVIGPDQRAPGLMHACGHEGAGIGLAPATGWLIAQYVTGGAPDGALAPFAPERFGEGAA